MRVGLCLFALVLFLCPTARATQDARSIASVPSRALAGPVVAEITAGDVLHPRFSPDGKTLAYAKVAVVDGIERDEVYLYSLRTGRTVRLVDSKTSSDYETYSAFVSDMEWVGPTRLRVRIADGDVDSTSVTFDTTTTKIVREQPNPSGDDYDPTAGASLTPDERAVRDRALRLFPDLDSGSLNGALERGGFAAPDGRIVVGMVEKDGPAISLIDTRKKTRARLVPAGDDDGSSLVGATYVGSSVLLLTGPRDSARFTVFEADGSQRALGTIGTLADFPTIDVVERSSSRLVFVVRGYHGAESGDNPLFVYDGQRLVRSSDYPKLVDASVTRDGKTIALCVWNADDTRRIVIRQFG